MRRFQAVAFITGLVALLAAAVLMIAGMLRSKPAGPHMSLVTDRWTGAVYLCSASPDEECTGDKAAAKPIQRALTAGHVEVH